jgi:hypothetical protein
MNKKLIDLLGEKNKRMDDFLTGVQKANELLPFVKQAKEETAWSIDVLKNIPPQAVGEIDEKKLENAFVQDLNIWTKALPDLRVNTEYLTTSGSGASGTTSQMVYSEILNVDKTTASIQAPDIRNWSQYYVNEYKQMQGRQNKKDEVKNLLSKLHTSLPNEFFDAQAIFEKADSGVVHPKEAANSMRNVMNHFQGYLLEKGRNHPGENIPGGQKWQFITDKLARGGVGSSEHTLLLAKATEQRRISIDLTNITKNMVADPLPLLRTVHAQWLDHLYTTLKLIS